MTTASRRRVLLTAAMSCFVMFVGSSLLGPLTPQVAHDLRLDPAQLGLLFGIAPLTSMLTQIPIGVAADRRGQRGFVTLGLLLVAILGILRWLSFTAPIFAVGQVVNGLTSPFVWAASVALVANSFEGAGVGRAIGVTQAAVNGGQGAGFAVGGTLGAAIGWRLGALLPVLPALVLAAFASRCVPQPPRRLSAGTGRDALSQSIRFLLGRQPMLLVVTATLGAGAASAATYILPFVATRAGFSTGDVTLLLVPFLVGSVTGGPLAGHWADRFGARAPLAASLAAAAVIAVPFAAGSPGPATIVPAYALFGFAFAAAASLASALVVGHAAATAATGTGAALGGLRIGLSLGFAAGPALGGLVYVRGGATATAVVIGCGFAAALVTALVATSRRRTVAVVLPLAGE